MTGAAAAAIAIAAIVIIAAICLASAGNSRHRQYLERELERQQRKLDKEREDRHKPIPFESDKVWCCVSTPELLELSVTLNVVTRRLPSTDDGWPVARSVNRQHPFKGIVTRWALLYPQGMDAFTERGYSRLSEMLKEAELPGYEIVQVSVAEIRPLLRGKPQPARVVPEPRSPARFAIETPARKSQILLPAPRPPEPPPPPPPVHPAVQKLRDKVDARIQVQAEIDRIRRENPGLSIEMQVKLDSLESQLAAGDLI